jgi:2-polyprenyl-3-methyl-5-hydroxy-6-metoxy-1,4-benzoquinol methylase
VTSDWTKAPTTAPAAEFDSVASNYEELHAQSIRLTGEQPEYFAVYKASYIARLLPPRPCRVLDYGCGIGMLAHYLKRAGAEIQIDGFDPSSASLARVEPDLLAQGVFTSDLRFLGGGYDVITIANVLHHVKPAERMELISEVVSRLAPGGMLVVFEHNPANPLTRWAVAQCAFDGDAILLWPRETRRYVAHSKLDARCDYIVFFPRWLGVLRRFEPLLRWCPLGAQYAMVGRRIT